MSADAQPESAAGNINGNPEKEGNDVVYVLYKAHQDPTWKDNLLHPGRVFAHYIRNLNKAFGHKFVFMVFAVYGLQQGLGNAYFFQGRDYYFKDVAKLSPSDAQIFTASSMVPWSIKPLYGMWADTIAVSGLFRTPVIVFAGLLGVGCLFLLAVLTVIAALSVVFMFGVNLSVSSPDVMIDASVAEKVVQYPKFGSDLQSLCWGSMAICSVIGYGTSGLIIQAGGPRLIFGLLIIFGLVVFVCGSAGWLGEAKTPKAPTKTYCRFFGWYNEQYEQHRSLFKLAIFMSSAALFLAMAVIFISDWFARFALVLAIALLIPGVFYHVNKRENRQSVANIGLYLFACVALTPDIAITMFYWYSDAEDGPNFSPIFVGLIQMFGYLSMVAGIILYNGYMTGWEFRRIFVTAQVVLLFVGMLDIIIVSRVNKNVGIPDEVCVLVSDTTLSEMTKRLMFVPMYVLAARVCPEGAEATVFAMFMSLSNFGSSVSIYVGSFLVYALGIHEDNYDNFIYLIIIRSICRLLPIPLVFYLVPRGKPNEEDEEDSGLVVTAIRSKSTDAHSNALSFEMRLSSAVDNKSLGENLSFEHSLTSPSGISSDISTTENILHHAKGFDSSRSKAQDGSHDNSRHAGGTNHHRNSKDGEHHDAFHVTDQRLR